MCGIAGIIGGTNHINRDHLNLMGVSLAHRGPDGQGIWWDENSQVGFVHRRLAIIDLTGRADQPMTSHNGRYTICFNGEIYNFKILGEELRKNGIVFKSNSDTEILLEAWSYWGKSKTLETIEGMFAFAIYDNVEKTVNLVRDRAGEKPLYYTIIDGQLIFASELKAISTLPIFHHSIDQDSLAAFFKYQYVPNPMTIYKETWKVSPGTCIEFSTETISKKNEHCYWTYPSPNMDHEASLDDLEKELTVVISRQMISDVPLGAFLSGGIDSSLIVALMQKQSSRKISTFTVAFEDKKFNEAHHARDVAKHLGTDHHECLLTPKDILNRLPSLLNVHDEPFADASSIPTFFISEYARKNVTVALSGDGGDELFGGYNRYLAWDRMQSILSAPAPMRTIIHSILSTVPDRLADQMLRNFWSQPSSKLRKIRLVLEADKPELYYDSVLTSWKKPPLKRPVIMPVNNLAGDIEEMLKNDFDHYLPDDVLTKVDRASMASSLETRAPFLAHSIIQLSRNFHINSKIRNGKGKIPLRAILDKYVPSALMERPKAGFSVPIGDWLKCELKPWSSDMIQSIDGDFLNKTEIEKAFKEHISGKKDNTSMIWTSLVWQHWFQTQVKK